MRKVLLVCMAVLIGIAFMSTVFAQTSEKKETTTTTSPGKKETTTTITKTKGMEFKGEVTNMDMATKMMSVKGKKGDMTFDVSNAKMKVEPTAGDKVKVKYMEKDGKMMASWVGIEKAKKTETTTTTTETKEKTTK